MDCLKPLSPPYHARTFGALKVAVWWLPLLALVVLHASETQAQGMTYGVRCYCGVHLGGDATNEDCIRACGDAIDSGSGYQGDGPSGTSARERKNQQRRRAQEIIKRLDERRLQEEQDRQRREDEQRRQDEERQRDFENTKRKLLDHFDRLEGKIKDQPKFKTLSSDGSQQRFRTFPASPDAVDLRHLDPKGRLIVDPQDVRGMSPEAIRAAGRKTHYLLDALEYGNTDWHKSITYLLRISEKEPNNAEVRDALHYVKGLYSGFLFAQNSADEFYKHGVRKWLENDMKSAFVAFSQAARQNPADKDLHRTTAYFFGLTQAGVDCKYLGNCPEYVETRKRFDNQQFRQINVLRERVYKAPKDAAARAALHGLEGMAAYHAWAEYLTFENPSPVSEAARRKLDEAGRHILNDNDEAAAKAVMEAARTDGGAPRIEFLLAYTKGRINGGKVEWRIDDKRFNQVLTEILIEEKGLGASGGTGPYGALIPPGGQALRQLLSNLKVSKTNPQFGVLNDKQNALLKDLEKAADDLIWVEMMWKNFPPAMD